MWHRLLFINTQELSFYLTSFWRKFSAKKFTHLHVYESTKQKKEQRLSSVQNFVDTILVHSCILAAQCMRWSLWLTTSFQYFITHQSSRRIVRFSGYLPWLTISCRTMTRVRIQLESSCGIIFLFFKNNFISPAFYNVLIICFPPFNIFNHHRLSHEVHLWLVYSTQGPKQLFNW